MKRLILAFSLVIATPAMAQETIPVPVSDLTNVVRYLQNGGTYAEASMLAEKIIAVAQAEQAKKAAKPLPAPKAEEKTPQ